MNILEACADPQLLALGFAAEPHGWRGLHSWLRYSPADEWRQLAIYRSTRAQPAPSDAADEAWLVVGRRGGKAFVMALIGVTSHASRVP